MSTARLDNPAQLLRDNLGDSANISLGKRLQISHDVSSAIGYLHDGSEPQTRASKHAGTRMGCTINST